LYVDYFHNPTVQENIRNSKEEQFQEGFLRELFVKILGYTLNPAPNYNLITEQKNETNAKKADGAILVNNEVVGIIELKDTKTTDLKNIETQAFGYKNYNKKAVYVVSSNFEKLRFYIDNAIDYEEFNLFTLTEEKFATLWLCLAYENIAKNLAKHLKTESVGKEEQITRQLYKDYSAFKRALFDDICANNADVTRGLNPLLLFKKTQKLLDRLLFILFAEDSGLLPPNSIMEIVKQWEQLKELDEYKPLYDRLKKYFGYMNTGRKGAKHDIFAYNGGLFAPDETLDSIVISDEILLTHLKKVSNYDFSSEVDVNILGHIFENSLTEIEVITNELSSPRPSDTPLQFGEGTGVRRKKDGVFYTPRYITAYIVENTIGKLCADKKAELEIDEQEYFTDKKRQIATRKKLNDKLENYRSWLLSLTICDPACGSGAFLNASLDFLMAEHKLIDELTAKLTGSSIVFPNIENAILENNLFGVDINDESVEIAKLSLWLRTAKPNRKLNSLNNNIKCGNSLISTSPPTPLPHPVLSDTPLHFGEGTGVRTVEVQLPSGLLANARELRQNQTEAEEFLWQILRNRQLNNLKFRRQHPLKAGFILDFYCAEMKLGIELDGGYHNTTEQQELDAERTKIINEYGINIIRFTNEEVLEDIENTLKKIISSPRPGGHPSPIWRGAGGEEEKAFDWHKEFPQVFEKGGFDVVIGNPPYVFTREKISDFEKAYYTKHYKTAGYKINTYILFMEKAFSLNKKNGLCGLIIPDSWLMIYSGGELRRFMMENCTLNQIVSLSGKSFEDANVETVIMIAENKLFDTNHETIILKNEENTSSFSILHSKKQIDFNANKGIEFNVFANDESTRIIEKMKNGSKTLDEVCSVKAGLQAYEKGKGIPVQTAEDVKNRPYDYDYQYNQDTYKYLKGSDVLRYGISWSGSWLWYGSHLSAPRKFDIFRNEKIIVREITGKYPHSIVATYSNEIYLFNLSTIAVIKREGFDISLKYVNAILNSTLMSYYFTKNTAKAERKLFPKIILNDLRLFPIKDISISDQQPFITLADKMLSLNTDLQTKRQRFLKRLSDNFAGIKITGKIETFDELEFSQFVSELAKQKIALTLKQQDEWEEYFNEYKTECRNFVNQIDATDREIDGLVYGVYGLTGEEVGIIEK
jgi:very-short-patch-repair endonuclease